MNTSHPVKLDGEQLSAQLLNSLANIITENKLQPKLNIILSTDNKVSLQYVNLKKQRGADFGIGVTVHNAADNSQDEIISLIQDLARRNKKAGIIVQLPLRADMDRDKILTSIPVENDVDQLNRIINNHPFTQPVAGAVKLLLQEAGYGLDKLKTFAPKKIHVIGKGFLVGKPIVSWLQQNEIQPVVYTRGDDFDSLRSAKIVISGAGSGHLVTADMISEGVVLIDAGTSSDSGEIIGDIHPDCYSKSDFYTPVPGGVGPLTLAKLFENTVILASNEV